MSHHKITVKKQSDWYISSDFVTRKSVHSDYCIVGYLDILGSTNRIKNEENRDESLNSVYNLYSSTNELVKIIKYIGNFNKIKVRIFSDNIVLLHSFKKNDLIKLKDNKQKEIIRAILLIVALSAIYQIIAFAGLKWCIRGGITEGHVFNNGILVWGDGLVRAYDIESNEACFPRVIIDDVLIEKLGLEHDMKTWEELGVNVDVDGKYYVDFVSVMHLLSQSPDVGDNLYELFEKNFAELESNDEKVLAKYRWFARTYAYSMKKPEILENYPNLKFELE